jgi:hypothetical protein
MGVNFYLSRERMFKEVDQCIALNKLETLMSFCNSCHFKILEDMPVPECHKCKVQRGIKTLSRYENQKKKDRNQLVLLFSNCRSGSF